MIFGIFSCLHNICLNYTNFSPILYLKLPFCTVELHDCRSIFHLVIMTMMVSEKDDDASAKECFHSIKDSLDHSPLLITGALTQFSRGSNEEDSLPLFSLFHPLCINENTFDFPYLRFDMIGEVGWLPPIS